MVRWCSGRPKKNGYEGLHWDGNGLETLEETGIGSQSCSGKKEEEEEMRWKILLIFANNFKIFLGLYLSPI